MVATDRPVQAEPTGDRRYPWHTVAGPAPAPTADVQGRPAGFVTRALANTIDVGVVVVFLVGGYLSWTAVRYLLHPASFSFPAPHAGLVLLIGIVVQALYFAVSWCTLGRTYGDQLLGLRVVNGRGARLRWGGGAVRALLCVPFPIGLLWVVVSSRNRSVQDVVLRTSVVYDWTPAG